MDMFSDNWGGQNRNRYTAFAIRYERNHFNLKRILHTFLEKGHMETENDSIHATVERSVELNFTHPSCGEACMFVQAAVHHERGVGKRFYWFKNNATFCQESDNRQLQRKKYVEQNTTSDDLRHWPERSFRIHWVRWFSIDLFRHNRRSNETDIFQIQVLPGLNKTGNVTAKKADLLSLCDSGQFPHVYRE